VRGGCDFFILTHFRDAGNAARDQTPTNALIAGSAPPRFWRKRSLANRPRRWTAPWAGRRHAARGGQARLLPNKSSPTTLGAACPVTPGVWTSAGDCPPRRVATLMAPLATQASVSGPARCAGDGHRAYQPGRALVLARCERGLWLGLGGGRRPRVCPVVAPKEKKNPPPPRFFPGVARCSGPCAGLSAPSGPRKRTAASQIHSAADTE